MDIKFERKISKLSGMYCISIPSNIKGSIEQNKSYKVNLGKTSFIRQPSRLGGVLGFSIPTTLISKGAIEIGKIYNIKLQTGTVVI